MADAPPLDHSDDDNDGVRSLTTTDELPALEAVVGLLGFEHEEHGEGEGAVALSSDSGLARLEGSGVVGDSEEGDAGGAIGVVDMDGVDDANAWGEPFAPETGVGAPGPGAFVVDAWSDDEGEGDEAGGRGRGAGAGGSGSGVGGALGIGDPAERGAGGGAAVAELSPAAATAAVAKAEPMAGPSATPAPAPGPAAAAPEKEEGSVLARMRLISLVLLL
jgi:hypothetical protein